MCVVMSCITFVCAGHWVPSVEVPYWARLSSNIELIARMEWSRDASAWYHSPAGYEFLKQAPGGMRKLQEFEESWEWEISKFCEIWRCAKAFRDIVNSETELPWRTHQGQLYYPNAEEGRVAWGTVPFDQKLLTGNPDTSESDTESVDEADGGVVCDCDEGATWSGLYAYLNEPDDWCYEPMDESEL